VAASGTARKRQPADTRSVAERTASARGLATQRGSARRREPFSEEAVRQHLPLVRRVVQRMVTRKPPEVAIEDLLSWGVVGLLDAMRKYDPQREAAFPTYAQYRIRGAILDYLRRCDWLPRSVRQKSHDLERVTLALEKKLGRPPGGEEIAAELGMSVAQYSRCLAALGAGSLVPLEQLGFGRGEGNFQPDDLLHDAAEQGPLPKVLRKERIEILASAIERLPEKERLVVSFYYFEELTMREMATALRLTEGRISQLHSQAMVRLRGVLGEAMRQAT
jgi:RNA polymerase sigma factor for flagellar operon FliA